MDSFTENWAIVYLEIVFVVLILSLGIPTLIYEISVSEDLKTIIRKHQLVKSNWFLFFSIPFIVSAFLFIWIVHPTGNNTVHDGFIPNFIISLLILLSLIPWSVYLKISTRGKIINLFEKQINRNIMNDTMETIYKDLEYLANSSSYNEEVRIIIDIFRHKVEQNMNSELYECDTNHAIYVILKNVFIQSKTKSLENKHAIIDIYLSTYNKFKDVSREKFYCHDKYILKKCIKDITLFAISNEESELLPKLVSINQNFEDNLFQIGRATLLNKNFLDYLNCMRKFEELIVSKGNSRAIYYYVGCLCYGLNLKNTMLDEKINESLVTFKSFLPSQLYQKTISFFRDRMEYDTVSLMQFNSIQLEKLMP